jgi:DNA-binding CsgD family transcriptional regulator
MAHPDVTDSLLASVLRLGMMAEADLAVLARSRHSEADLAESRALGAALLERMRAVFQDVTTRLPYCTPSVAAQLGASEAEFSRLEGTPDPDRWASAAAAWEDLQCPYPAGYLRMREAEATLELRRDRPRAARALAEARNVAGRLGALPLLRATEKLAARAGITLESADARMVEAEGGAKIPERTGPARAVGRAGRVPRGPYDLTPREQEVLVLVADGRSDGEIAEALFISKKTASFHVAMIKGKLGARSRVEIATDAIGLGVIEAPTTGRA